MTSGARLPYVDARDGASDERRARAFLAEVLARYSGGDELAVFSIPAPEGDAESMLALDPRVAAFWQDGEAVFAGIGQALRVDVSGRDRFDAVRAVFHPEMARATKHDAAGYPLPSLRAFGGFAFTPGRTWPAFGDASFVLPRWTYHRDAGRASLTLALSGGKHEVRRSVSVVLEEYDALIAALRDPRADPRSRVTELAEEPLDAWSRKVESVRTDIRAGRVDKVVLARRSVVRGSISAIQTLRALTSARESAVRFAFARDGATFLGVTPERLIHKQGLRARTEAVAGSIARGQGEALLSSDKDLEEHGFVSRFVEERLRPFCATLHHPARPELRRLAHVEHLVTPFVGELERPTHVLELVRALHPTPAVCGTPTDRAREQIERLEDFARGWYAGPIGWFDESGDGEFRVALRSGLVEGARAEVFAGAGLVDASEAQAEYAETDLKQRAVLAALGGKRMNGVLTEWARLLVGTLSDAGVTNVVVSPGSRSTPFTHAAATHPELRCHSIIDERAAAFFALGQGRVTGRPSVLIATSGTAAAHYYPAVIEAYRSRVPLIVLSADRPTSLQGCDAPQTIDQTELFGRHVRRFVELGDPTGEALRLRVLRERLVDAVGAARWGPVHINAKAEKPLEPFDSDEALRDIVDGLLAPVNVEAESGRAFADLSEAQLEALYARLDTPRGVIACGPNLRVEGEDRRALRRLASSFGFVVFAEATSQHRFQAGVETIDAFDVMLSDEAFRAAHRPSFILELGGTLTSRSYAAYVHQHADVPRVVIKEGADREPYAQAEQVLVGDPGRALRALVAIHEARPSSAPPEAKEHWSGTLLEKNERAWGTVESALSSEFSEARAVAALIARLPSGARLQLGNSLPVRHVDRYARARSGVDVLSQRGANGIDGMVASAAGAASASEGPVCLLLGDVSLLHDVSSLGLLRRSKSPVLVVVLNNDGGRIFEQLPIAEKRSDIGLWTTPHGLSFSAAAAMYGLAFVRAETLGELESGVDCLLAGTGGVIEVRVPPSGAARTARDVERRIREELS